MLCDPGHVTESDLAAARRAGAAAVKVFLFDPAGETAVREDSFEDGTGPSVYAGHRMRGSIRAVVLRGRLIVVDGQLVDQRRDGRYLTADGPPAAVASATTR
jgi:hypothetical protein